MFETQGRTRNRTRDLPKKGSAFILSSDHWTKPRMCVCVCVREKLALIVLNSLKQLSTH